ncbi:MAG: hypothetical protein LBM64_03740 [Deltaproteobacteria bacterium]|nr:hypothetical protein [Deltaproteobacteria bacterium]
MDLLAGLSNFWVKPPLVALIIFLMSGWVFCPLLALWARLAEASSRRVFYNNLARQICQAALAAAVPTLLGLGALAAWQLSKGAAAPFAANISALPGLALFAAFFLLQLAALLSWKNLRQAAPLQLLLLALTALAALGAVVLLFSSLLSPLCGAGLDLAQAAARYSLFNVDYSAAWAFAGSLGLIGLTLAAVWSVCWLFFRRNRDDFGRDYYNFAAGRGCALAFTAGAASLLAYAALLVLAQPGCFSAALPAGELSFAPLVPLAPLAVIALHVVCCILWFSAARAASPLRHKAALWLSLLLWTGALALACQVAHSYYLASIAQKI